MREAASEADMRNAAPLRLRLPATSANLGPGFDAVAVALDFYLEVEAEPAEAFSITATGHDRERCSRLDDNLVLGIYERVLKENGKAVVPLAMRMQNGIPLGMGCGSSAAGRLAAIALAVHFGRLDWSAKQILEEACALEGHPDNAAACWLGGLALSAMETVNGVMQVHALSLKPKMDWRLMVVLPAEPLATKEARGLLPESYSRADAVYNIQRMALLTAAFADGAGELVRVAMQDKLHQPYRAKACPLLPLLQPLAGESGVLGVALSGAGPSVLLVLGRDAVVEDVEKLVRGRIGGSQQVQTLLCAMERRPASCELD